MTTGFTVPNAPDVQYNDQAEPDSGDFQILQGTLYGVLSGCQVTPQTPTAVGVTVADGYAVVNGAVVKVVGLNKALDSASANNRIDLIAVDATGAITPLKGPGTDANPRYPAIPDGYTVLAAVYIPVGVASTGVTSGLITDKRVMLDMTFRRQLPAATSTALSVQVQNDNTKGMTVTADGTMSWLGGAKLADITNNLMRWTGGVRHTASSSAVVPLAAQGAASQSADLFNVLDSASNKLGYIDASGNAAFANIKRGTGDPNGVYSGRVGDIYLRTDGGQDTILYVKETYNAANPTAGWYPLRRVDPASNAGNIPIGGMLMWGGVVPPVGWLLCDGQPYARVGTYAALFSAISTTWGAGDGTTTFNVPNFSGRVPVGSGTGGSTAGLTTRTAGQTGGAETATLSIGNLAAHGHTENPHDHGGATGLESANHYHVLSLTSSAADISHDHQDGQHVHYAPGGIAKYVSAVSTNVGLGLVWNTNVANGQQSYNWDPTTGGNLTPTNTSTAGGSHSHSVTGQTSGMSVDHTHGINPATPTINSTGSGTPFGIMPPFTVAPIIIRYI